MLNSVKEMKNGWRGSVDNVEVSFRVNGLGLVRLRARRYYRLVRLFAVIFRDAWFFLKCHLPYFQVRYAIKFWTGPKTIILGAGHTQLLISVKHIKTIILGAGYTQLLISVKHICSCVRPALKTFE